jgi:hypothetical protein
VAALHLHETQLASAMVAVIRRYMARRHGSPVYLAPGLQAVDRWKIGVGAQPGDVDVVGVGYLEKGRSLGALNFNVINGERDHERRRTKNLPGMADRVGCTRGGAGQRWPIAIGFARSTGVLEGLAVAFYDGRHFVIVVVGDDLQYVCRASRNARPIFAIDAFVGVDDDEEIAGAVLISVMRLHRWPPLPTSVLCELLLQ